ncbi:type II toxin-antitoxin system PemK/MazF family toxin [Brevundimonas balnearis]|uniref:Type II toxin-antitoxin system PemK/MazF family toxin n=1 Tax=Brevundimonas balnearis TaxID=1572858 RepID=A0ABV6R6A0_9CAUL
MPTFEFGDVVRAPFPYTDRETRQHRPALVVAAGLGEERRMVWVLMITSAENRPWPGDVDVGPEHRACGLPAPSVVRTAKIATVEAERIDRVGTAPADLRATVRQTLSGLFVA